MANYYSEKLSAERLRRVYEIAPRRVRQYLDEEVSHMTKKIHSGDLVLEMGCGYGRILPALAKKAKTIIGIDNSLSSLSLGKEILFPFSNCHLAQMNARQLAFSDKSFDTVVCIQNGISAFHIDQKKLIEESIRITKRGGTILFSSYSEKFWTHRMEWFQLQSAAGLLGEIDYDKTQNGMIVCKDGFTATTVGRDQFIALVSAFDVEAKIVEVDESSIFCEITVH